MSVSTPLTPPRASEDTLVACLEQLRLIAEGGSVSGLTDTQLRATPVPVDGSSVVQPVSGSFWQATQPVSVASLPLPSGAATDAGLAAIFARQADGTAHIVVDNLPATQPVSIAGTVAVSGPLTDAQIRATPLPVSGTVAISGTVPVSGTFWQATQPVSGTVAVSNFPASQPVTGTFFQATQPVSAVALPLPSGASTEATLALIKAKTDNLDVALSTRAITGLTDTQLRAAAIPVSGTFYQATQPVSGTFWQATQPISAVALPLPSGASTEATLALIKAKTDNLDVALSTRAVTGLTDAQLRASAVPVSGTVTANIGTTNGLALDATLTGGTTKAINRGGAKGATTAADVTSTAEGVDHQALDIQVYHGGVAKDPTAVRALTSADVVTAAQGAAAAAGAPWAARLSDGAAFYDGAKTGQLPAALVGGRLDENIGAWLGSTAPTVGSKTSANSVPVVIASDQGAVPITPPTLTKGTQGATGFSTQDLKDASRVLKTYTVSGLATVTTEALIQLTPYADLAAGTAATTFAVTSGKRLRIQKITVTVRATGTVNVGGIVRLRLLGGTVLVGSPVHDSIGCMCSNLATAVVGNAMSFEIEIPDGLELSGTMQFGLTQLFSATGATIDVHVTGYEY